MPSPDAVLDAMLAALPEEFYRQYAPWWKGPVEDLLDGKSVAWPPTQESLWKVLRAMVADPKSAMVDFNVEIYADECFATWKKFREGISTTLVRVGFCKDLTCGLLKLICAPLGYRWTGEAWEKGDERTPMTDETQATGELTEEQKAQEAQEKLQAEAHARYNARLKQIEGWGREKREAHLCVLMEQSNHSLVMLVNQMSFLCGVVEQSLTAKQAHQEAGRIVVPK